MYPFSCSREKAQGCAIFEFRTLSLRVHFPLYGYMSFGEISSLGHEGLKFM